mmetsp:Transcript_13184/g.26882  ORF Transcript_13184/g.26882 Transcript_13184/m.26882 type:complete len:420 (+) Transcript_13184:175-1434(+)
MTLSPSSLTLNLQKLAFSGGEAAILAARRALQSGISRCSTTLESEGVVADLLSSCTSPTRVYLKVGYDPATQAHSLDPEKVLSVLHSSNLVSLSESNPNVTVTAIAHNPEEVRLSSPDSYTERWADMFEAFSSASPSSTFGICSNGLSLPPSHPLHLSLAELLMSMKDLPQDQFRTVMYPFNPLETLGASQIPSTRTFETISFRPLLAYPDGGAGDGHPFKLVDHMVPAGIDQGPSSLVSTHTITSVPTPYEDALSLAMGHFDAEALVSDSGERTLTPEERETVDGCKLLQGMLVEQDRMLSSVRSLSVYNSDLISSVIPLIKENFEEMDEDSSEVLSTFFRWHGVAVRCHTAWSTRRLLIEGGEDGKAERHDIPDEQTLQSYSLSYALEQKGVDMVEVGLPKVEYVDDILSQEGGEVG